ncbi:MAG: hypothetical protein U0R17_05795 [Acidimicrobiia bacterium]
MLRLQENLVNYFNDSIQHRNIHKCGSYPYADGLFLNEFVRQFKIKSVLEIGTGIGYSSTCLALDNDVKVTTIEMIEDHIEIAKKYWNNFSTENIYPIMGKSLEVLPDLTDKFEMIFFDAFAPNPQEAELYLNLIDSKGIIVTTNISWNDTTQPYLKVFNDAGLFTIVNDDTAFSSFNETFTEQSSSFYLSKNWSFAETS